MLRSYANTGGLRVDLGLRDLQCHPRLRFPVVPAEILQSGVLLCQYAGSLCSDDSVGDGSWGPQLSGKFLGSCA